MPEEKLIGVVTHYFSSLGVAVIDLTDTLSVGDKVRIIGGKNTDFDQEIDSMEMDHKKIDKAKAGDSVGTRVNERVREGYKVYKV